MNHSDTLRKIDVYPGGAQQIRVENERLRQIKIFSNSDWSNQPIITVYWRRLLFLPAMLTAIQPTMPDASVMRHITTYTALEAIHNRNGKGRTIFSVTAAAAKKNGVFYKTARIQNEMDKAFEVGISKNSLNSFLSEFFFF